MFCVLGFGVLGSGVFFFLFFFFFSYCDRCLKEEVGMVEIGGFGLVEIGGFLGGFLGLDRCCVGGFISSSDGCDSRRSGLICIMG